MLTATEWSDRFAFSISPEDRKILSTQFYVSNPQELANLRPDIPPNLEIEAVEFAYDVQVPWDERHRWIRCCECARDHNHRRGFVLRFVDHTRATVGRDCGREKHSLDYDRRIQDFEGHMTRARLLRQTLVMLKEGPLVIDHLKRLRADSAIMAARGLRGAIMAKLPDFGRRLEAATNGRIEGKVAVRDFDAEKSRDERLDAKLEAEARRLGRNRNEPGVDQELLSILIAAGDRDASKDPILKLRTRVVHTFVGHEFFDVLPRLGVQAELIESKLLEAFSAIRGKASDKLSKQQIESVRKRFLAATDEAITLTSDAEAAFRFLAPENIMAVVRAVNRFTKPDDNRQVSYIDGLLIRTHAPNAPLVSMELAPFALSSSVLARVREKVMDAYSGLWVAQ